MQSDIPTSLQEFEIFICQLDTDALATLIPTDRTTRATAIEALTTAIETYAADLSEKTLLRVARAGLCSLADDNRFVLRCAEEFIRRESESGQLGFVAVVVEARDEYDPGHRAFEDTVLDQLIDSVLPRFALTPLTRLLGELDYDVLSGADGFAELFGAAFSKVGGEISEDLLEAVQEYVDDTRQCGGDLDEVMGLLTTAASHNTDNGLLKDAIVQLGEDIGLQAQLETEDLEVAKALLERVGRDLSFQRAVQFHNTLQPLQRFATKLPYDFVEATFIRCWKDEREERYPETTLGRTLWPLFVNTPEATKAFCLKFAEDCDDRKLFVKVVEWAIRDAGTQSPEGEQTAKDTLAVLNGLDPVQERARAALEERRSTLSSSISWAFSRNRFDEAKQLMEDESNRSIMNASLVEDVISYASFTDRLKSGDTAAAKHIGEACLELLVYKRTHPDAPPEPKPGKRLSLKERKAAKAGGIPSGLAITQFVTNLLVLATAEVDSSFAKKVSDLARATIAEHKGRTYYPALPFNLGCYHAKKGEKTEVLECVKQAIAWGKTREEFLAEGDFAAYHQDADFLEALESDAQEQSDSTES